MHKPELIIFGLGRASSTVIPRICKRGIHHDGSRLTLRREDDRFHAQA